METQNNKYTEVIVRGTNLKLMTYTRSLELCARMNYESENLDFIDTIQRGEVLYDLGACEGRFSIYAALKGVRVVSFEPENRNFSVFQQNIHINHLTTELITPIHAGVGEKDGKAIIKIGQPWEGGHQKVVEHEEVRNDLNFNFIEKQEIEIISLDSFLEKDEYPFPDYLKIDIDGSEMTFIIGSKKTLQSEKIKGIIFELYEFDPNFDEIINQLRIYGFNESQRYAVPNEPNLFNIIFKRVKS